MKANKAMSTISCPLKLWEYWQKMSETDLVRTVTNSVLMCEACLECLEKWMIPMEELSTFMWMEMSEPPDWNDVEACIREKRVPVDDVKCFDHT